MMKMHQVTLLGDPYAQGADFTCGDSSCTGATSAFTAKIMQLQTLINQGLVPTSQIAVNGTFSEDSADGYVTVADSLVAAGNDSTNVGYGTALINATSQYNNTALMTIQSVLENIDAAISTLTAAIAYNGWGPGRSNDGRLDTHASAAAAREIGRCRHASAKLLALWRHCTCCRRRIVLASP